MKQVLILLLIGSLLLSGCINNQDNNVPYPGAYDKIEIAPNFTKYHFYDENVTCIIFDDSEAFSTNMQCLEGLK